MRNTTLINPETVPPAEEIPAITVGPIGQQNAAEDQGTMEFRQKTLSLIRSGRRTVSGGSIQARTAED